MTAPVLYGVAAWTSDDFQGHVLTDEEGPGGAGTRLSVCGQSHRKWLPVAEFVRPEVFTPCRVCVPEPGAVE